MNIVFDLDGTLIDSKSRLYQLFQHIVKQSDFTFEQYWALKKNKVSHYTILTEKFNFNTDELEKFNDIWMDKIESNKFLSLDTLINGVDNILKILSTNANLYVCTARQHKPPVINQLKKFNINQYFTDVLVTEQKYSKQKLIGARVSCLSSNDWLVGDTGHDIETGKVLGMNTCGVKTGFQSERILCTYTPTILLESVTEFMPTQLNQNI